jgi:hypothetical protein
MELYHHRLSDGDVTKLENGIGIRWMWAVSLTLGEEQEDWKGVLFGVHQHSRRVLHATSRMLFSDWCDPRCCVLGCSWTNVIQGHYCALGHYCTNASPNHCCTTMSSNSDLRSFRSNVIRGPIVAEQWGLLGPIVAQQWIPAMEFNHVDRQTDRQTWPARNVFFADARAWRTLNSRESDEENTFNWEERNYVRLEEETAYWGGNCILRSSIICAVHQILLGWSNQGGWDGHAGHAGRIREMRNTYKILVGKPEGKRPSEDLGVDGMIILKRSQGNRVEKCSRLDSHGSGHGQVAGSC